MMFEFLAGEPLHPRGREALATTISPIDCSPAKRRPTRSIAPELDALCVAALAAEASERPTAKQLADAIQGFLDGDRDVARRRVLASELSAQARSALEAGDREAAMRTAGRAVALDASSTAASEIVVSLVVEEPAVLPPEIATALEAEENKWVRARSSRAIVPYAAIFVTLPLVPLLEVKDWAMLAAVYAAFAMMVLVTWINARVGVPIVLTLIGHAITALLFSRFLGPFVITPIMLCAILLSASSIPWMNKRWWAVLLWCGVTVMLPFVLEWGGVFAKSWELTTAGVLSYGTVFDSTRAHPGFLIGGHVIALMLVGAYSRRIGRDRNEAQRRMFLQAWHLRYLLPKSPSTKRLAPA
jgi:serine/threonine-protein kinase